MKSTLAEVGEALDWITKNLSSIRKEEKNESIEMEIKHHETIINALLAYSEQLSNEDY